MLALTCNIQYDTIKIAYKCRKIAIETRKSVLKNFYIFLPGTHLWCGLACGAQRFCSSPHPGGGPSTLLAVTVPHPAKTRNFLDLSVVLFLPLIQAAAPPPF